MPLTSKGNKILSNMKSEYGDKKGKSVFYASRNKGTISGVDPQSMGNKVHRQARKSKKYNLATNSFQRA
jgi:hypothetical protein